MIAFITIAGFIIAFSAFLYLLNAADSGKRLVKKSLLKSDSKPCSNTNNIAFLTDKINTSSSRKCPLCTKALNTDEPLYASFIETMNDKKVLIYGCPYCYKDDAFNKYNKKTNMRRYHLEN